jgi:RNA polymerase sigma-32 factor
MKKKQETKKKRQTAGKKSAAPRKEEAAPLKDKPRKAPPESLLVKYDPLQRYLWEIGQHQLLSREEEKELGMRVLEHGDRDAAYRLVTSNLRLVVKIAMEFQRVWMQNLLDLIQEGNIGLMQAVQKFDPYKGVRFSYYASFWIKAYILKFIMDNWKLVKIGTTQSQRKLFFNLAKERDKLIAQGYAPEPKLLAERLDVKEEEVVEMTQRLGGWEVSLSSPMGEDSREAFGAFLPDPKTPIDDQLSEMENRGLLIKSLHEFRKTLSGKEADIFDNRIMAEKPLTLQDLGDKYNISRERIRQLQEKIINQIKKWLKEKIPNFDEEFGDFLK